MIEINRSLTALGDVIGTYGGFLSEIDLRDLKRSRDSKVAESFTEIYTEI